MIRNARQRPSICIAGLLAALGMMFIGAGCTRQARGTRHLESGKKYLEAQDYPRAVLEFRTAAKLLPADAEPYYYLGLAHLGTGALRTSVLAFRKAVELNPKHAQAQLKLAELMTAGGSQELVRRAQESLQKILADSPTNNDALFLLGAGRLRLGDQQSAEKYLWEALKNQPQDLRSAAMLAQIKLYSQDAAGAERILTDLIARAPHSPELVVMLGLVHRHLGRTAEAETAFRRALAIDPKSGAALFHLGNLQFSTGRAEEAGRTFQRLSSLPNKDYAPLHAIFLANTGKLEAAIAEFEGLAKRDPQDRAARNRLVSAYLVANRVEDARKVLQAALQENPKDVDALLERSKILIWQRAYSAAGEDLLQVLRYQPKSPEAHYAMSRVHQGLGAMSRQRQELNEAIHLNPGLLAARIELANLFLSGGDAQAALNLLNEAPKNQQQAMPILIARNWVLMRLGNREEARQAVEASLAKFSAPDLLVQDGILKLVEHNVAAARAAFESALKQDPEHLMALRALATSYAAQKQSAQGTDKIRQLVTQHPRSVRLQLFLGDWLVEQDAWKEARAAYTAAKAADPGSGAATVALAKIDIQEGKLDSARQGLTGLLARPDQAQETRLLLATLEEQAGNRAAAIEHYRKLLDIDQRNVIALNNLAYQLAGNPAALNEALKFAQQAKELDPNSPAIDDTLGWVMFQKGVYQTAVTHLESAASRASSVLPKYHLGMAYLGAGQTQKGKQLLETALRTDASVPEAKTARELLAKLANAGSSGKSAVRR